MKYGVIVCPKCGMAKGVEAARKTTTCPCGRQIRVHRARLKYPTDSPKTLADTVGKVNAALRGAGKMPTQRRRGKGGTYRSISEKAMAAKGTLERLKTIAVELTNSRGEFTLDDFRKVAPKVGRDTPERTLARLQEQGVIYEVSDGRYRAV